MNLECVSNGRRMCSILAILYLFYKLRCSHSRYLENINNMLFMLGMIPQEVSSRKWMLMEVQILRSFVPNEFCSNLAHCLVFFVNLVVKTKHLRQPQWLSSIPLIHILKEKINISDIHDEHESIDISQWTEDDIKLPSNSDISKIFSHQPR